MKTIAIKIDDELHTQLMAIAQLEGVTATEIIRDGVIAHLQTKQSDGTLAAKAQAVLDEIDGDAEAKRAAIQGMLGTTGSAPAKGRTRKAVSKPGNGDPATS